MVTTNDLLKEIDKYSEKYDFSFQFWGTGLNNVFIYKKGIEIHDIGQEETSRNIIIAALQYIYQINNVPESERIC